MLFLGDLQTRSISKTLRQSLCQALQNNNLRRLRGERGTTRQFFFQKSGTILVMVMKFALTGLVRNILKSKWTPNGILAIYNRCSFHTIRIYRTIFPGRNAHHALTLHLDVLLTGNFHPYFPLTEEIYWWPHFTWYLVYGKW